MTDRIGSSPLDPDRLDRVLAPFAEDEGLWVGVEDLDGVVIAASSPAAMARPDRKSVV